MGNDKRLVIPHGHEEIAFIASVSGGKDSTAMLCALREAGIPHRAVFADTGWEAPQTYEYLDTIERVLGLRIERVRSKLGGMVDIARLKAGYPLRKGRWCTDKLKFEPMREFHEKVREELGCDTVSVVGVRGEESEERAKMAMFEFWSDWDGYIWRPLLHWTVQDVLAIHHRHGLPVNPLYRLGFERVGCMPCIMSRKEDVRLMAQHFPDRVNLIRATEQEFTAERARRNEAGEGDFKHPVATFFMPKTPGVPCGIDEVVAWSRTTRGGRQLPLLEQSVASGCARWGLCDPPAVKTDDDAEDA